MVQFVDEHLRLRLFVFVSGQIDERDEVLDNAASLIAHRANEDGRPKLAAILAAVVNLGIYVGLSLERLFHLLQRFWGDAGS